MSLISAVDQWIRALGVNPYFVTLGLIATVAPVFWSLGKSGFIGLQQVWAGLTNGFYHQRRARLRRAVKTRLKLDERGRYVERDSAFNDSYVEVIFGFGRLFLLLASSCFVFILVYLVYPEGSLLIGLSFFALNSFSYALRYVGVINDLILVKMFQIRVRERYIRHQERQLGVLKDATKMLLDERDRLLALEKAKATTQ